MLLPLFMFDSRSYAVGCFLLMSREGLVEAECEYDGRDWDILKQWIGA